jgi:ribosome-binding protein aMBF1 (putative translation factor)
MAPFRRIERLDREEAFEDLMASLNPVAALRREVLKARRRSGLSQRELALKMGTSQSVVTRIERGEYAPSFQTLRKLAEATGSQLVIRLDAPTEAAGST